MVEADDPDGQRSLNPKFVIGMPDNELPAAARARLYQYHKRAGTLAMFFDMYPSLGERELNRSAREDLERER